MIHNLSKLLYLTFKSTTFSTIWPSQTWYNVYIMSAAGPGVCRCMRVPSGLFVCALFCSFVRVKADLRIFSYEWNHSNGFCRLTMHKIPGGGGTHVYWQYRYVRPLRPPFHALPAVPKHIFFIARRSKAYLFHWPTRSYGTQLKSQFSRPPFHVKSQFPRPPFGEGPLVLKPLGS